MAALRILFRPDFFKKPFVSLNKILVKDANIIRVSKNEVIVPVRNMGSHERRMNILPTNFEEKDWRNQIHFYFLLGIIPLGAIIVTVNFFKGPATLADIPPGYEPKHWEYYKHPISQFIAKYIIDSPEKVYERHMHIMAKELDRIKMRKLEEKVAHLQKMENVHEFRSWYFVPYTDYHTKVARDGAKNIEDDRGHPK